MAQDDDDSLIRVMEDQLASDPPITFSSDNPNTALNTNNNTGGGLGGWFRGLTSAPAPAAASTVEDEEAMLAAEARRMLAAGGGGAAAMGGGLDETQRTRNIQSDDEYGMDDFAPVSLDQHITTRNQPTRFHDPDITAGNPSTSGAGTNTSYNYGMTGSASSGLSGGSWGIGDGHASKALDLGGAGQYRSEEALGRPSARDLTSSPGGGGIDSDAAANVEGRARIDRQDPNRRSSDMIPRVDAIPDYDSDSSGDPTSPSTSNKRLGKMEALEVVEPEEYHSDSEATSDGSAKGNRRASYQGYLSDRSSRSAQGSLLGGVFSSARRVLTGGTAGGAQPPTSSGGPPVTLTGRQSSILGGALGGLRRSSSLNSLRRSLSDGSLNSRGASINSLNYGPVVFEAPLNDTEEYDVYTEEPTLFNKGRQRVNRRRSRDGAASGSGGSGSASGGEQGSVGEYSGTDGSGTGSGPSPRLKGGLKRSGSSASSGGSTDDMIQAAALATAAVAQEHAALSGRRLGGVGVGGSSYASIDVDPYPSHPGYSEPAQHQEEEAAVVADLPPPPPAEEEGGGSELDQHLAQLNRREREGLRPTDAQSTQSGSGNRSTTSAGLYTYGSLYDDDSTAHRSPYDPDDGSDDSQNLSTPSDRSRQSAHSSMEGAPTLSSVTGRSRAAAAGAAATAAEEGGSDSRRSLLSRMSLSRVKHNYTGQDVDSSRKLNVLKSGGRFELDDMSNSQASVDFKRARELERERLERQRLRRERRESKAKERGEGGHDEAGEGDTTGPIAGMEALESFTRRDSKGYLEGLKESGGDLGASSEHSSAKDEHFNAKDAEEYGGPTTRQRDGDDEDRRSVVSAAMSAESSEYAPFEQQDMHLSSESFDDGNGGMDQALRQAEEDDASYAEEDDSYRRESMYSRGSMMEESYHEGLDDYLNPYYHGDSSGEEQSYGSRVGTSHYSDEGGRRQDYAEVGIRPSHDGSSRSSSRSPSRSPARSPSRSSSSYEEENITHSIPAEREEVGSDVASQSHKTQGSEAFSSQASDSQGSLPILPQQQEYFQHEGSESDGSHSDRMHESYRGSGGSSRRDESFASSQYSRQDHDQYDSPTERIDEPVEADISQEIHPDDSEQPHAPMSIESPYDELGYDSNNSSSHGRDGDAGPSKRSLEAEADADPLPKRPALAQEESLISIDDTIVAAERARIQQELAMELDDESVDEGSYGSESKNTAPVEAETSREIQHDESLSLSPVNTEIEKLYDQGLISQAEYEQMLHADKQFGKKIDASSSYEEASTAYHEEQASHSDYSDDDMESESNVSSTRPPLVQEQSLMSVDNTEVAAERARIQQELAIELDEEEQNDRDSNNGMDSHQDYHVTSKAEGPEETTVSARALHASADTLGSADTRSIISERRDMFAATKYGRRATGSGDDLGDSDALGEQMDSNDILGGLDDLNNRWSSGAFLENDFENNFGGAAFGISSRWGNVAEESKALFQEREQSRRAILHDEGSSETSSSHAIATNSTRSLAATLPTIDDKQALEHDLQERRGVQTIEPRSAEDRRSYFGPAPKTSEGPDRDKSELSNVSNQSMPTPSDGAHDQSSSTLASSVGTNTVMQESSETTSARSLTSSVGTSTILGGFGGIGESMRSLASSVGTNTILGIGVSSKSLATSVSTWNYNLAEDAVIGEVDESEFERSLKEIDEGDRTGLGPQGADIARDTMSGGESEDSYETRRQVWKSSRDALDFGLGTMDFGGDQKYHPKDDIKTQDALHDSGIESLQEPPREEVEEDVSGPPPISFADHGHRSAESLQEPPETEEEDERHTGYTMPIVFDRPPTTMQSSDASMTSDRSRRSRSGISLEGSATSRASLEAEEEPPVIDEAYVTSQVSIRSSHSKRSASSGIDDDSISQAEKRQAMEFEGGVVAASPYRPPYSGNAVVDDAHDNIGWDEPETEPRNSSEQTESEERNVPLYNAAAAAAATGLAAAAATASTPADTKDQYVEGDVTMEAINEANEDANEQEEGGIAPTLAATAAAVMGFGGLFRRNAAEPSAPDEEYTDLREPASTNEVSSVNPEIQKLYDQGIISQAEYEQMVHADRQFGDKIDAASSYGDASTIGEATADSHSKAIPLGRDNEEGLERMDTVDDQVMSEEEPKEYYNEVRGRGPVRGDDEEVSQEASSSNHYSPAESYGSEESLQLADLTGDEAPFSVEDRTQRQKEESSEPQARAVSQVESDLQANQDKVSSQSEGFEIHDKPEIPAQDEIGRDGTSSSDASVQKRYDDSRRSLIDIMRSLDKTLEQSRREHHHDSEDEISKRSERSGHDSFSAASEERRQGESLRDFWSLRKIRDSESSEHSDASRRRSNDSASTYGGSDHGNLISENARAQAVPRVSDSNASAEGQPPKSSESDDAVSDSDSGGFQAFAAVAAMRNRAPLATEAESEEETASHDSSKDGQGPDVRRRSAHDDMIEPLSDEEPLDDYFGEEPLSEEEDDGDYYRGYESASASSSVSSDHKQDLSQSIKPGLSTVEEVEGDDSGSYGVSVNASGVTKTPGRYQDDQSESDRDHGVDTEVSDRYHDYAHDQAIGANYEVPLNDASDYSHSNVDEQQQGDDSFELPTDSFVDQEQQEVDRGADNYLRDAHNEPLENYSEPLKGGDSFEQESLSSEGFDDQYRTPETKNVQESDEYSQSLKGGSSYDEGNNTESPQASSEVLKDARSFDDDGGYGTSSQSGGDKQRETERPAKIDDGMRDEYDEYGDAYEETAEKDLPSYPEDQNDYQAKPPQLPMHSYSEEGSEESMRSSVSSVTMLTLKDDPKREAQVEERKRQERLAAMAAAGITAGAVTAAAVGNQDAAADQAAAVEARDAQEEELDEPFADDEQILNSLEERKEKRKRQKIARKTARKKLSRSKKGGKKGRVYGNDSLEELENTIAELRSTFDSSEEREALREKAAAKSMRKSVRSLVKDESDSENEAIQQIEAQEKANAVNQVLLAFEELLQVLLKVSDELVLSSTFRASKVSPDVINTEALLSLISYTGAIDVAFSEMRASLLELHPDGEQLDGTADGDCIGRITKIVQHLTYIVKRATERQEWNENSAACYVTMLELLQRAAGELKCIVDGESQKEFEVSPAIRRAWVSSGHEAHVRMLEDGPKEDDFYMKLLAMNVLSQIDEWSPNQEDVRYVCCYNASADPKSEEGSAFYSTKLSDIPPVATEVLKRIKGSPLPRDTVVSWALRRLLPPADGYQPITASTSDEISVLSDTMSFRSAASSIRSRSGKRLKGGNIVSISSTPEDEYDDESLGLAGVGKTTVAALIASKEEVRKEYNGGVVWINVGNRGAYGFTYAEYKEVLLNVCEQLKLTQDPSFPELINVPGESRVELERRESKVMLEARDRVGSLIRGRRGAILLILDDVWRDQDLELFRFKWKKRKLCDILVTTRVPTLSASETVCVDMLSIEEGVQLLISECDQPSDHLMASSIEVKAIVRETANHPIAIKVVGRWLALKHATAGVINSLEEVHDDVANALETIVTNSNVSTATLFVEGDMLFSILDSSLAPTADGKTTKIIKLMFAAFVQVFCKYSGSSSPLPEIPIEAVDELIESILQTQEEKLFAEGSLFEKRFRNATQLITEALTALGVMKVNESIGADGQRQILLQLQHGIMLEYGDYMLSPEGGLGNLVANAEILWNQAFVSSQLEDVMSKSAWDDPTHGGRKYALEFIITHMIRAEMIKEAAALLRDDRFIRGRLTCLGLQKGTNKHIQDSQELYYIICESKTGGDDAANLSARAYKKCAAAIQESLSSLSNDDRAKKKSFIEAGLALNALGFASAEIFNWDKAVEFYENSYQCLGRALENDEVVASILFNNSIAYFETNQYEKSMESLDECLNIRTSISGEQGILVAQTICKKGDVFAAMSDYPAAMYNYRKGLDIMQLEPNRNRIEIGNTFQAMGQLDREKGEIDQALKLFSEALRCKKIEVGLNSPDLADIYKEIGHTYAGRGVRDSAIPNFEEAMRLMSQAERTDENEADMLTIQGVIYSLSDENDYGMDCYQQALDILQSRCSQKKGKIAALLNLVANEHVARGENRKAFKLFEESLHVRKDMVGFVHLDVAATLCNMANLHQQREKYDKALRCLEEALRIQKLRLGDSLKVASTLELIGNLSKEIGQLKKSEVAYEDALRILRGLHGPGHASIALYGPGHASIARILHEMGDLMDDISEYDEAINCFSECLEIRKNNLGLEHEDVAETLYSMGFALHNQGEHEEALDCFDDALQIRRRKFGSDSTLVGDALNIMGFVEAKKGEYDIAFRLLDEALDIRQRNGENLKAADTLKNLGNIHREKKEYTEALECYDDCLRIRKMEVGLEDERVADANLSLGNVYSDMSENEEAMHCYEQAYNIRRTIYGDHDDRLAAILQTMGIIQFRAGNLQKGREHLEDFARIRKNNHTDESADYVNVLFIIGNIHKIEGNGDLAKEAWAEAYDIFNTIGLGEENPQIATVLTKLLNKKDKGHQPSASDKKSVFGRIKNLGAEKVIKPTKKKPMLDTGYSSGSSRRMVIE